METTFDVPARTFLRVVYGDDGFFFRRFHHETGECPDASVPAWNSGGMGDDAGSPSTRVVVFTKTMSLPSVIERLLGSGGAITALSDPVGEWEEMTLKARAVLRAIRACDEAA